MESQKGLLSNEATLKNRGFARSFCVFAGVYLVAKLEQLNVSCSRRFAVSRVHDHRGLFGFGIEHGSDACP